MKDKSSSRESQGEIPESPNTWKLHEVKCPTYKQKDLEPTQYFPEKSDLWIISMQKNIQKVTVALARVRNGLL